MRLQRVGEAENPAEMQHGKWTAEGKVKRLRPKYPRRKADVTGWECVGIPRVSGSVLLQAN